MLIREPHLQVEVELHKGAVLRTGHGIALLPLEIRRPLESAGHNQGGSWYGERKRHHATSSP